jgi:HK97 family phage major capsid protein
MPTDVVKRLESLHAEMTRIGESDSLTPADERRYYELLGEFERTRAQGRTDRRSALLAPGVRSERGVPYGDDPRPVDTAQRVVDDLHRSGHLPDRPAEVVTGLLTGGPVLSRRATSDFVRAAGNPAYLSAFCKLFSGPRGDMLWSADEREAFAAVEEYRALSVGTDSAGGFLVPLSLDPSVMITNGGVASPLRETARVVTTATDSWSGVTSAGITAEFQAEAAEVNDNSPTFAQPTIPVHRMNAFVPYSMEIGMDAVGFVPEMTRLLLDAANVRQTQAFVTGTGTGEPQGVITGLVGGSSVVTGVGEAFTAANVFAVQAALGPRFQAGASWMGNVATLNAISQFETTNGARVFPEVNGNPPTLLRKPLYELSPMDGVINPAATETNHLLLYGDMREGYVIADRLGSTVEGINTLFGPNGRPTGQRGLVLWQRVGAQVVNPAALRVLNVPTAA